MDTQYIKVSTVTKKLSEYLEPIKKKYAGRKLKVRDVQETYTFKDLGYDSGLVLLHVVAVDRYGDSVKLYLSQIDDEEFVADLIPFDWVVDLDDFTTVV